MMARSPLGRIEKATTEREYMRLVIELRPNRQADLVKSEGIADGDPGPEVLGFSDAVLLPKIRRR